MELRSSFLEFLTQSGHAPVFRNTGEQVHATTILAMRLADGVLMAGDRRATMGNEIASRDIEKVFRADDWSCIGIAGSAGLAVQLVKIFQLELEHYEKVEGRPLSLDGKANWLAATVGNNLGLAIETGLLVQPLFAGIENGIGRLFSYDITGGRYEERDFHAIGSGAVFARGSLKKLYRPNLDSNEATRIALECLFDAADDDSATGGPDIARGIYPVVAIVDSAGFHRVPDNEVATLVHALVSDRGMRPDGPLAAVGES